MGQVEVAVLVFSIASALVLPQKVRQLPPVLAKTHQRVFGCLFGSVRVLLSTLLPISHSLLALVSTLLPIWQNQFHRLHSHALVGFSRPSVDDGVPAKSAALPCCRVFLAGGSSLLSNHIASKFSPSGGFAAIVNAVYLSVYIYIYIHM